MTTVTTAHVLIVEDDREVREALGQTLEIAELTPILAGSFLAAKDRIAADFEGVILSDIRMPGRDGFHLLAHAREVDPDLPVVLLTGEGDIPMAVRAIGEGAFDFLEKPCAPSELLRVLERALAQRALIMENRRLRAEVEKGDAAARMLFGGSAPAEALRAQVRQLARAGSDGLVLGPPGSGISKVAEVIHLCSARSQRSFVKHAASDLSPARAEAAMHQAIGGSLFLDEITQMPSDTQLWFTSALDKSDRAAVFLGSSADVETAVATGALNGELYYRLAGMSVRVPALAERPEDIPILFRQYVAQACEQAGLPVRDIPQEVIADLMGRDWPGNARALMSEAMRFSLGLDGQDTPETAHLGLAETMARMEKTLLEQALRKSDGRAAVAAEDLKLPRKTFYDKLARHGIRSEDFRID